MSTQDDRFAALGLEDESHTDPSPEVESSTEVEEETSDAVQQGQEATTAKTEQKPKKTLLDDVKKERAKRQQLEEERKVLIDKLARYETQEQAEAKKQQPEQAAPDFETDPLMYLHTQTKTFGEKLTAAEQKIQQYEQQEQQRLYQQQLYNSIGQSVQKFAQQKPDFKDALQHVRKVELTKMTPFIEAGRITEEQANQWILQNELQAAATMLQQGADPAEMFYAYAQAYGYQPAATDDLGDEDGGEEIKPDQKAAEKVKTLSNGQKYAKNKGSGAPRQNGVSRDDDPLMKELFGL